MNLFLVKKNWANFIIILCLSLVSNLRLIGSDQKKTLINEIEPEIGIIEHLDTYLPDSISLINEKGEQVWLSDIIDKPTILNFVYFQKIESIN